MKDKFPVHGADFLHAMHVRTVLKQFSFYFFYFTTTSNTTNGIYKYSVVHYENLPYYTNLEL